MKNKAYILLGWLLVATPMATYAQSVGQAVMEGLASITLSDQQVAQLSRQAVQQMDTQNPVAGPSDPYTQRLNRIVRRHRTVSGIPINYKVYKVKDVNAFATADGSVRVFQGLMDIMSDSELLAIMGHEIGHVVNKDTRDAMKSALRRSAFINLGASQGGAIGALSRSQATALANGLYSASFSRRQETEADDYSYTFLRKNGYNVLALASSFEKLAKLSGGSGGGRVAEIVSSHPDSQKRAQRIRDRARRDGVRR
ncbi:M48 family metalloprotease [Rudanella paleaurantiibacter]|uniref:M48 family metalloprotease n=1 Tax=Rudanella paleaurantiibacter TaxID=2614655 RepID=A0A7J5TTB7_9BACT|nr:M48 family metallopeptidase [Rudanella paleaurantiibacter]KAB7727009.1 M48 family metalloprotease [Rudanella paleaurantiibacter]